MYRTKNLCLSLNVIPGKSFLKIFRFPHLVRVPLKSQPNKPPTSYFITTMTRTKPWRGGGGAPSGRKQLALRHVPTGPVVRRRPRARGECMLLVNHGFRV
jgi:hypothetical protein